MSKIRWERCREARTFERDRQAGDAERALLRAAGNPVAPATKEQLSVLRSMVGQFRLLRAHRHADRLRFLIVALHRWEASDLIDKAGAELKRMKALSSASGAGRQATAPRGG